MFEIINTAFAPVKTVKLGNSCDFRPCATGTDIRELQIRTSMEGIEMDYAASRSIIASAAHSDRETSINNARREAIERISLSAWWVLERPFIAKVNSEDIVNILKKKNVDIPPGFSISIGFVESIHPDYKVACSIITNSQEYPFAVLGGGCSLDDLLAAEKALYESIQSWTATQWIDDNGDIKQKIYWDTGELSRRVLKLSEDNDSIVVDKVADEGSVSIFNRLDTNLSYNDGVYITEITENSITAHLSTELARLAMKDGEHITVFTPHNI